MFFNLFAAAEPSANVCLAHGTLWHRIPYHKGSNKSNQLINRVFNAIHSGKDTVKQWYCYNRIELWLRISSQAITVCFGETPGSRSRNPGWKTLPYEVH